ncbi:hypothetical protein B0T16DRAFT_393110 [Cercophora newfieldiana]|uniref:Uncharacterized protein n=1 Tax=Cercophora newfieldiana TaxID=92897 RepID=A0AA39XUX1_9PEZI|nr:hypothetical protein B0T16DRAFT_393110 [Cercophora newfieldiana]
MPLFEDSSSDPESSSQYSGSSDSEAKEAPSNSVNPASYNSNVAGFITAASYSTGSLTNCSGTKHKLEDDESQQLAKIPRLTSSGFPETYPDGDDGSVYADSDEDGDEDADGDEEYRYEDGDGGYDDQVARQLEQQLGLQLNPPIPQEEIQEPITQLRLRPSFIQQQQAPQPAFPQTALQLFYKVFPHLRISSDCERSYLFKALANRPVKRIPQLRMKRFHVAKIQNAPSYFMQAVGEALPNGQRCDKCRQHGGSYSGVCVVLRDPEGAQYTSGACAGCWYNRNGCTCSIRNINGPRRRPRSPKLAPPPPPAVPKPTPVIPPAPAPAPALPARPVAPPPQPGRYVIVPPPQAAKPAPAPTVALPNSSIDARVKEWEEKYSKLGIQALLDSQRHLLELQDDLTMRLLAMNRVLASRNGGK